MLNSLGVISHDFAPSKHINAQDLCEVIGLFLVGTWRGYGPPKDLVFFVDVSTCSITTAFVKPENSFMSFCTACHECDKHETEMSEALYIARKTNMVSEP